MADRSDITPFSPIPVIIYNDASVSPTIIYIDTQSEQQPVDTGVEVFLEIQKHVPDTRASRFANRCALRRQTVSTSTLLSTPQGPHLSPPIYDAMLTRALRQPNVLGSISATQLIRADEVLVVEWQANQEARALAAKLARMAVRVGVVAFSILNLVGI